MPSMSNNKHGGDFHPLIDTINERKIITDKPFGYETNVYSYNPEENCMCQWLFRFQVSNEQQAIERHQREMAKAMPKIEHPCRCGSLNTRYNVVSNIWECPSCLNDRM